MDTNRRETNQEHGKVDILCGNRKPLGNQKQRNYVKAGTPLLPNIVVFAIHVIGVDVVFVSEFLVDGKELLVGDAER